MTHAASSVQIVDKPHLVGKPWYYGTITRAQCDTLLNNNGEDGDFLVRDSETNVNILYIFTNNWKVYTNNIGICI